MLIITCIWCLMENYFLNPKLTSHKHYEALRLYFVEKATAKTVAEKFGYSYRGFTALIEDFKRRINKDNAEDPFFIIRKKGRKEEEFKNDVEEIVINLRKKNYSIPDIKVFLDSKKKDISETNIFLILRKNGFARLPRRDKIERIKPENPKFKADASEPFRFDINEAFSSNSVGLFCFIPYIKKYGIDKIIEQSGYPETSTINRLSSIMCFLALKLSNVRRYSTDDIWCMDRGSGLFAILNVLPKVSWLSSYSDRVTKEMNFAFLKELHKLWKKEGLLSDTTNLDFTTIPYWGDANHLENNWSGTRKHALASMLALLAQDPDTGIIDYGSTDIKHDNKDSVILEFLDFYHTDKSKNDALKYLVFDSKFTNYENLGNLDKRGVKFVTIRRRGKNIVDGIDKIPKAEFQKVRVPCAGNKTRLIKYNESFITLKKYEGKIRQIAIVGHGKIKPALIITNDFEIKIQDLIRKYCRRWLIEKSISEQIDFFHLNRVSSSMVIKVDFDLTMSILAQNIYRLFAQDLDRYSSLEPSSIYEKFIYNGGFIEINEDSIHVKFKKKRNLPLILSTMQNFQNIKYPFMANKKIIFSGATVS